MQEFSVQELNGVSESFLTEIKILEGLDKWDKVEDEPVQVYRQERNGRNIIKAFNILHLSLDTIFNYFSNPLTFIKSQEEVGKSQILFQNEDLKVIYIKMNGFGPISDRQMVVVNTIKRQGNKIYFGNKSCKYPYPVNSDIIRAEVHAAGYVFEQIDNNSTKVTNFADIDIKGSIPDFVKKSAQAKRALTLSKLENTIKNGK